MTLAEELVLSRNQLLQGVNTTNIKATELSSQRIDLITSELQEAIMKTRMQPIDTILNKFKRIVRNRSQHSGKTIDFIIKGEYVELDKTILESINEPLLHLYGAKSLLNLSSLKAIIVKTQNGDRLMLIKYVTKY